MGWAHSENGLRAFVRAQLTALIVAPAAIVALHAKDIATNPIAAVGAAMLAFPCGLDSMLLARSQSRWENRGRPATMLGAGMLPVNGAAAAAIPSACGLSDLFPVLGLALGLSVSWVLTGALARAWSDPPAARNGLVQAFLQALLASLIWLGVMLVDKWEVMVGV